MQQFVSRQMLYFLYALLALYLIYLLSPILTPFIFGILLAYLANPLVYKLEKHKVTHLLSVILVFALLIVIVSLIILMLVPLIQKQIQVFIEILPKILMWIQNILIPWANEFINFKTIETTASASLAKAGGVISTVLSSGYTVFEWLVNLVLIPVVTFYMLRDWDKFCNGLKNILPKSSKSTVLKLARQCDEVLSAFFRGQLFVMLSLCIIYAVGLSVIGLNVGFIIGVIGGILSIVPYLGSLFVLITASLASMVQFGSWEHLTWVLVVFLIGQSIEGYILTPYFVGKRIGLHPVVLIFAVMAGGALFGFFGVLAALPAAAIIKVLLMNLRSQYI